MKKDYIYDAAERQRQLDRLRDLEDEDIDTTDPDARVLSEEQWARARPFHEVLREHNNLITLRIDPDVLEWYQRQGEGYQARMNQILRSHMEAEQKTAPSR